MASVNWVQLKYPKNIFWIPKINCFSKRSILNVALKYHPFKWPFKSWQFCIDKWNLVWNKAAKLQYDDKTLSVLTNEFSVSNGPIVINCNKKIVEFFAQIFTRCKLKIQQSRIVNYWRECFLLWKSRSTSNVAVRIRIKKN